MGYQENFIDEGRVPLPKVMSDHLKDNTLLHYQHFSILFSRTRRLPICTAVNIDGDLFNARARLADSWKYEPSIAKDQQVGSDFYSGSNKKFHRGHIVRRLDPCWGSDAESEEAEADTFYFTNACPQHCCFNPRIWLELERNILEKGSAILKDKICVLSGPVLDELDKPFLSESPEHQIFIPGAFWKVVIWKKSDGMKYAVGFMQSQQELICKLVDQGYWQKVKMRSTPDHYEKMTFKNDAVYQVSLQQIENATGLKFAFSDIRQPYAADTFIELAEKLPEGKARADNLADGRAELMGLVL